LLSCLRMILSENRFHPRIKSGGMLFGIMRVARAARTSGRRLDEDAPVEETAADGRFIESQASRACRSDYP